MIAELLATRITPSSYTPSSQTKLFAVTPERLTKS
jgi:hypothetical protein